MPALAPDIEQDLIDFIAQYHHDPLGYVMAAFDWGVGELTEFASGPDQWQVDVLNDIGEKLRSGKINHNEAIQIAVASGHGIGKSALVAWIILWAMSTHEDTKGVVTANTENQLKTKTWAELAKWFRLCINRHWFEYTATAIFSRDKEHEKTWRIDMVPWSERNTEAFAGLHNKGARILLVFDEASAIPDLIWEVAEGALTDEGTEIIWCCFGNPTRNIGRFRECFGKFKHRWNTRQIDSRSVSMTNKIQLQKWVDDYGEDSDFVRVRVRGVFPSASFNALIGPEEVEAAMRRHYDADKYSHSPMVLGVDVARQGDDSSVICRRQGLRTHPLRVMRIPDTMLIAQQVMMDIDESEADGVFVDATGGYGVGVVDALRNVRYSPMEVYFSGKASDSRYFNKRSEMWFDMVKWIKAGGALPNDPELAEELCAATYTFQGDKFRLCDKDDIKEEIGRSPDKADALALTFAFPVSRGNNHEAKARRIGMTVKDDNNLNWNPLENL
jgi:hypothetical protein